MIIVARKKFTLNINGHRKVLLTFLCFFLPFASGFSDVRSCFREADLTGLSTTGLLASNTRHLTKNTQIYKTHFDSSNWHGDLVAHSFNPTGDDSTIKSILWRASEVENENRRMFSINPLSNTMSQGIKLSWDNLNTQQKKQLKDVDTPVLAKKRLEWLRGSHQDEGKLLRARRHFLGDIIDSNISTSNQGKDYGYSILEGNEGENYSHFLKEKSTQKQAVFVGANDGALHAFDATNGEELFAYVPNAVLPKVVTISMPNYGCKSMGCLPHEFLVDGKSSLADAYFNDAWHTVLVGSLGYGGKGLYALDVSSVDDFKKQHVLWEISDNEHLGYINQQASIV